MSRVKRGTVRRAKRQRVLARAKGFFQTKSKLYRAAKEAVDKSLGYAYVGRKLRKRDFRRLWIVRINAAARSFGLDPVGGLYSPLGASGDDRPRGLMLKEAKGTLLAAETDDAIRTDFLGDEEFEAILSAAEERAAAIVTGMRTGRIGRDPRDGKCPSYCALAPVCRIERRAVEDDPEAAEEAAA